LLEIISHLNLMWSTIITQEKNTRHTPSTNMIRKIGRNQYGIIVVYYGSHLYLEEQ
jgi:hypothetical protein